MGISGIGIWQLLIVLAIAIMLFGTRRIRDLGGDIGGAIKGFRQAVSSDGPSETVGKTDKVLHHSSAGEGR